MSAYTCVYPLPPFHPCPSHSNVLLHHHLTNSAPSAHVAPFLHQTSPSSDALPVSKPTPPRRPHRVPKTGVTMRVLTPCTDAPRFGSLRDRCWQLGLPGSTRHRPLGWLLMRHCAAAREGREQVGWHREGSAGGGATKRALVQLGSCKQACKEG